MFNMVKTVDALNSGFLFWLRAVECKAFKSLNPVSTPVCVSVCVCESERARERERERERERARASWTAYRR
jgi:hypothetical protein